MAETQTPHYPKWVKPDIGGDASNWGNVLNSTLDEIDSRRLDQPTSGRADWFNHYVWRTTIKGTRRLVALRWFSHSTPRPMRSLFAVIGYMFGGGGANFSLPNLIGVFPMGMTNGEVLGQTGGEATHTLGWNEMPVHAHSIEQTPHGHGASQGAHSHGITTGGHNHALHDNGRTHTYATLGGGVNIQPGSGGNMSNTGNTGLSGTGITIDGVGNLGGNTDTQQPGINIQAQYANINNNATDNAGGGAAHNNLTAVYQPLTL